MKGRRRATFSMNPIAACRCAILAAVSHASANTSASAAIHSLNDGALDDTLKLSTLIRLRDNFNSGSVFCR
jgi:hypothetical protein